MKRVLLLLTLLAACSEQRERTSALPLDGPARGTSEAAPAAPLPAIPADAPLVVVLGDSIAAGLHLPADQAFPAALQRTLAAEGAPFRLVNAGVSGDTTAGALRRIDWVLKQEPAVLVIEIGGNDGLRGLDLEELEKNLRTLVQRGKDAGANVLLLGVRLPPSYGEYAEPFNAIYPRVAKDLDVAFVPFFMEGVGGVMSMNLHDGLHPNAEGHEKLAQKIAPAVKAELARRKSLTPAAR